MALVLGAPAAPVAAQSPAETAAALIAPADQAVDRGLAYLARSQNDDGAYGGGYGRNVAVVGLSGMAYLASGSTPERGQYAVNLDRCLNYLLSASQPSGFITIGGATSQGPMYGHGFATLFLAEAYGMSPRDDLRDKLTAAINLIVSTQNDEGGWRYQPRPDDADLSVTICQIMALRAARNAGIHVPADTVEKCTNYVRKCQNPDGGFRYMLNQRGSVFPRSAAGVVALYSAGVYEGPEIERGLAYLDQHLPGLRQPGRRPGVIGRRAGHFYYGHYYGVQAMWQAGGERWARWYPAIRDDLLAAQQPDGRWDDSNIGPVYSTAMASIILQIPNDLLPIFQR
ncbi:prenyltransferase/squalene oxidase repeat-containing protein [Posidoniimonas polymericola]|nr:prenyltransferase/squalene oxidase repeat-containing protein [Posidoniimonas polymericola]